MKKIINLIFCFSVFFAVGFSEIIKFRDGREITGEITSMDLEKVYLKNSKSFSLKEINEIQFNKEKSTKTLEIVLAPSESDKKDSEYFFALADEFSKKNPGANGLILLDEGEYFLKPDGTWVLKSRMVKQILKEGLKDEWGEVSLYTEDGRERGRIIKANVYLPDGSIYTLDSSKIKTSKPQTSGEFFIGGYTLLTYPLPKLSVGAIIDYEVEEETYNPFRKDFFFPSWSFQDFVPVKLSSVKISVPENTDFYYSVRNFPKGKENPQVSRVAGEKTYKWQLENIPAIASEPMMPSVADIVPAVQGAIFNDWNRIFDWMGQMHRERSKPSEELIKFTQELVKDCKTPEEKVAKIYHYVQKEIRYIAVKVGVASGWGGYDANLTWKRRYGCCIDKALLLTAMFNAVGIKSSPIILNTNDSKETDFSIPQIGFNHAISAVELNGKKIILDSTGYDFRYPEIAPFDYGVKALNIFNKSIDSVPEPKPDENGSYYDYSIDISSDGYTKVTTRWRYTGPKEGMIRGYYRSVKKEEQKRGFENMIKEVSPSAKLINYEVNNAETLDAPFSISLNYAIKNFAERAGDILIFKLPDFEKNFTEVSLMKRKYPIKYDVTYGKYYTYKINIPDNYEVISLPEKTKISLKHGSFDSECRQEKSQIVCRAKFEISSARILAEDYSEYKMFLEKTANYTKKQIFLRDLTLSIKH